MTRQPSRARGLRGGRPAGLAALALVVAVVSGCSSAAVPNGRRAPAPGAPSLPTPLATSVQTSAGTWATIPMGRLDDPLNTFWQLFYHPRGAGRWSDQVEATATATNGGLVLASEGASVLVGVRASVNLTFTPLISSSDQGRSWADGLVTKELAARPDALALAGTQALALVGSGRTTEVLASHGGISTWRALLTRAGLASGPSGKACGLGALTAVGYLAGRPLIGASCAQRGLVGLFAWAKGAWRLVGPELAYPLDRGRAEVLALQPSGPRALVLLAVVGPGGRHLLALSSGRGGGWSVSPPLTLGANEQVASFGPGGPGQFFALLRGSSGKSRLMTAPAGAAPWRRLPPPPAGTGTVAFSASGEADALVVHGAEFSAWSLSPGSKRWAKAQAMDVPVQYGSSS